MTRSSSAEPNMLRISALLSVVLISLPAHVSSAFPPGMPEVQQLIEKLGSPDFAEREAATKRLEELGATARDALQAACKSEDPEIARRAHDILHKVEGRIRNEKILAPTMIELDARDTPLDSVLAELSKQGKCQVVLGGPKPEELANQKITVSTAGKVPFWNAVLKVCESADLQIAMVGGFVAPGATPYLGRPKGSLRIARNANQAVVLEARDPKTPRRPAGVYGAVLIEAIPLPKNTTVGEFSTAVLQVWQEPRLQWHTTTFVKVTKATDATGARLPAEFVAINHPPIASGQEGVTVIRKPDGSFHVVRDSTAGFQTTGQFVPNTHQAVIRFKREGKLPELVKQLDVSLFATVQSGIEPISRAHGLVENQTNTAVGESSVDMTATYRADQNGKLVANVTLSLDHRMVEPVGVADELPGVKGTNTLGFGNHSVFGILVTDKNGKPYGLGVQLGTKQLDGTGNRTVMKMTLELVPDRNGIDPPDTITFWGTHAQPIEVPVTLKDVPLNVGK